MKLRYFRHSASFTVVENDCIRFFDLDKQRQVCLRLAEPFESYEMFYDSLEDLEETAIETMEESSYCSCNGELRLYMQCDGCTEWTKKNNLCSGDPVSLDLFCPECMEDYFG